MANPRGRPRNFEFDETLERALHAFWRNGYQGTSLSELTEVTGLSKPSLYAAFGDKEALYLKALDRYVNVWLGRHMTVLERTVDGREAVQRFLRSAATMLTDPELPGGCFIINGVADCGVSVTPEAVEHALRKTLAEGEGMLTRRIQRAQQEGHAAPNIPASELATFYYALLAGLGVKAKSGASRRSLYAAIDVGMGAWPAAQ